MNNELIDLLLKLNFHKDTFSDSYYLGNNITVEYHNRKYLFYNDDNVFPLKPECYVENHEDMIAFINNKYKTTLRQQKINFLINNE